MMRFILLLLVVLPQLAFADVSFTPPATDLSVIYLSNIFGVVDGVLHGSGSQIMGTMFGVLNAAVLSIGGVIITYVLLVSTMNTAHEGKALGQKWNSMWIPIRSVTGVALLLPKATGYSMIQIMVMWVVVQGVGAADAVAGAAINYLARGGVLVQANPPPDQGVIASAGNILKSEICMLGANNSLTNQYPTATIPAFISSLQVVGAQTGQSPPVYSGQPSDVQAQMEFPGPGASAVVINNGTPINFTGMCGSVKWKLTPDYAGTTNAIANPSGSGASDSRSIAVQQMVLDLEPVAQSYANYLVPPTNANTTGIDLNSLATQNQYQVVFAAADYKGIMLPYLAQETNYIRQGALSAIQNNAANGWIVLGGFYFELSQLNVTTNQSESSGVVSTSPQSDPKQAGSPWANFPQSVVNALNDTRGTSTVNVGSLTNATIGTSCNSGANAIDNYACLEVQNGGPNNYYQNTWGAAAQYSIQGITSGVGALLSVFFSPLVGPIINIISDLGQLGNAQLQNTDPILTVTALGGSVLNFVTAIWLIGAALFAGVAGISAVPCVNPAGFGALSTLIWMVPLISSLTIALFGAGALMAYYVPLIPFILFVFGGIGWMIAVIESMVAAPLVALGLAYPTGDEHFGKAESAIMLLLNIFMRPSMMVIGFFAGVILSHVGLWLLNQGFGHVWGVIEATNLALSPGLGVLWGLIAGLIIYVGFVLAIINKSFALIFEIPDKVMRWIGHHDQLGGGAKEGAEEVKGGYSQGAQAAAQGAGKGFEAAASKAEAGMEKQKEDGKSEKKKPEIGAPGGGPLPSG